MPRKPPPGKSLAELKPELVKEWHPTKNSDLTPRDIFAKAGKKVWWKCANGDDHEWEASPESRFNASGCPICNGRMAVKSNSLATLNPKLAQEWHPTKNGELTPFDVRPNSGKKVWWKCPEGDDHEWEANVFSRNRGNG